MLNSNEVYMKILNLKLSKSITGISFKHILDTLIMLYIFIPTHNIWNPYFEILFLSVIFIFSLYYIIKNKIPFLKLKNIPALILFSIILINTIGALYNINSTHLWAMLFKGSFKLASYLLIGLILWQNGITIKNKFNNYLKWFIYIVVVQCIILGFLILFKVEISNNLIHFSSSGFIKGSHINVGLFESSIYFSIYLLISSIITIYLINNTSNDKRMINLSHSISINKHKVLYLFLLFIQILGICFSGYHPSIIIGMFIIPLYFALTLDIKKIFKLIMVGIILTVILTVILIVPGFKKNTLNDLIYTRSAIYAATEIGYNNMLFGIGTDNYLKTAINNDKGLTYYTPFKVTVTPPNCSYLLIFAENGVISLLLLLLLIVTISYIIIKNTIISFKNDDEYSMFLLVLFILLIIVITSFISNVFFNSAIMMIFFALLIPFTFTSKKSFNNIDIKKYLNNLNTLYTILLTALFTTLIWLFLIFGVINKHYGTIMERSRNGFINSINNMHLTVEENLIKYDETNKLDKGKLEQYKYILEEFTDLTLSYVNTKNTRWYKSRPFTDLYGHYEDLYINSDNFTSGSIYSFFELTIPVQIFNYSADKVFLPFYRFTAHYFPEMSDLTLIYYFNTGFSYNPLAAIRTIKDDYLLKGNYEKFKELHKEIARLLEPAKYNDTDYLLAVYRFGFRDYKIPWRSGMAQGVLLDITAQAYYRTKDEYYYNFGKKLLPAFYIITGLLY